MSKHVSKAVAAFLFLLALISVPAAVHAQLPASPRRFVDNLDEHCYTIAGPTPNVAPLRLDHLNPVLIQMGLPFETVKLTSPQKFCTPVKKNNIPPPDDTLPFIQALDWECYGIAGPPLNLPLNLTQLNPVIAGLLGPNVGVTVLEPQQLCVPVAKTSTNPPPNVLALIQYIDVKCYRVTTTVNQAATLTLTHLNPLFSTLSSESSSIGPAPQQLCVPVTKNQAVIPVDVRPYVRFSDVLCYPATGAPLNRNLVLRHLNPVLAGLPPETDFIGNSLQLCVPVAKNGMFPPGIQ
jgi:hypothetical protein